MTGDDDHCAECGGDLAPGEDDICPVCSIVLDELAKQDQEAANDTFTTETDCMLDSFLDLCPFCLDELRRGVPADGRCGHEAILEEFPHLRFNAHSRLSADEIAESQKRFLLRQQAG